MHTPTTFSQNLARSNEASVRETKSSLINPENPMVFLDLHKENGKVRRNGKEEKKRSNASLSLSKKLTSEHPLEECQLHRIADIGG